jgi:uncharacterized UPF0160 family protein
MKYFNKLVTHNSTFHADEIFAIALLWKAGHSFTITRTRDKEALSEAIDNPLTLVLDVGMIYDREYNNFDHHQDKNLMSAAGLIWAEVMDDVCKAEYHPYITEFISAIDAIDTNRDLIYHEWEKLPGGFRNVSSIIKGLNREVENDHKQYSQFLCAASLAEQILDNELYAAKKKYESEQAYQNRQITENNVAIFNEFNTIWKEKKQHVFVVMPYSNTGWQIQSIDTAIDIIPKRIEQTEGFTFRHISGFMAVVKEKEVAIEFAKTLNAH